ncbi:hypothetical protein EV426DRAFT_602476, partial [Tirmania nivea]
MSSEVPPPHDTMTNDLIYFQTGKKAYDFGRFKTHVLKNTSPLLSDEEIDRRWLECLQHILYFPSLWDKYQQKRAGHALKTRAASTQNTGSVVHGSVNHVTTPNKARRRRKRRRRGNPVQEPQFDQCPGTPGKKLPPFPEFDLISSDAEGYPPTVELLSPEPDDAAKSVLDSECPKPIVQQPACDRELSSRTVSPDPKPVPDSESYPTAISPAALDPATFGDVTPLIPLKRKCSWGNDAAQRKSAMRILQHREFRKLRETKVRQLAEIIGGEIAASLAEARWIKQSVDEQRRSLRGLRSQVQCVLEQLHQLLGPQEEI